LNALLNQIAIGVWVAAIPSIGLTIMLGAIVGDIIWFAKGPIIRMAVKSVINKSPLGLFLKAGKKDLEDKADDIAEEVKIGFAVKIQIILMNIIMLFMVGCVFLVAYIGCNFPSKEIPVFGVFGNMCSQINSVNNQAGSGANTSK